jgi:hypothetical protein
MHSAPYMQGIGAAWHDFNAQSWLPYTAAGPSVGDLPTASHTGDLQTAGHLSPYGGQELWTHHSGRGNSRHDNLYGSFNTDFVVGLEGLTHAGGIADLAAQRHALQHSIAGYGGGEGATASDFADRTVRESLRLPDILR